MVSSLTRFAQDAPTYTQNYNAYQPIVQPHHAGWHIPPAMAGAELVIALIALVGLWKVFVKAGKPGWAAIIPFYNTYTQLKIVGRPGWWLILLFIPLVNIILGIIVLNDLSKSFGKGVGYTLLLIFLPFIGYPMLGWGDAVYRGPSVGNKSDTGATA